MASALGATLTMNPRGDSLLYTEDAISTERQDWDLRRLAAGVVWYHNFENTDEVNAFRWTGGSHGGVGNDPFDNTIASGTARWEPSDGFAGGGCLELNRRAGIVDSSAWWRPLSPLLGSVNASTGIGNGKPEDDPGAGIITPKDWDPTWANQTSSWRDGYYSDVSMRALPREFDTATFDGEEFYYQFRHKVHPNRWLKNHNANGKRLYFSRTDVSNTSQEFNIDGGQMQRDGNWAPGTADYFSMYRSGSIALEYDGPNGVNQSSNVAIQGHEPGTEFAGVGQLCNFTNSNNGLLANCWQYDDQWATFLVRLKPGTAANVTGGSPNQDTFLGVWVARQGETNYTKIWDQPDAAMPQDKAPGENAVIMSVYMNREQYDQPFWFRTTQLILSRNFIPPPQV